MDKQNNIYFTSIGNKNNKKDVFRLKEINDKFIMKRNYSILSENNRNNYPTSLTYNLSSNVVNQISNRNNSNYNIKISKVKVNKKTLEFNSRNRNNIKYKKISLNIKKLPPLKSKLDYSKLGIRNNTENVKLKQLNSVKKIVYKPNNTKEFSELIPDNSINDIYNKLLKYEMNDFCRKKKLKPFKMH